MDDEFAHECGEGDFGCFAFGEQVLVEITEDGIAAAAGQSGHVACGGSSAADRAFAASGAAIAVEEAFASTRVIRG